MQQAHALCCRQDSKKSKQRYMWCLKECTNACSCFKESVVAVCLVNVLQNVSTNSISNFKSLLGYNNFHKIFCRIKSDETGGKEAVVDIVLPHTMVYLM